MRRFLYLITFLFLFSLPVQGSGPEDAIIRALESGEKTITLLPYSLTPEKLESMFHRLRDSNRLPWYSEGYRYTYSPLTGMVHSIDFLNLDPETHDYDAYEQAVREVLNSAVLPGMSQRQIALSVHDWLVSHSAYDESLSRFSGYDLLIQGTAVCEGYARAYMDVLKRAGVECVYVHSETMGHAWNMVSLDGSWYHVDTTWADPVSDCFGLVRHTCFLTDDETISRQDHSGWESEIPAPEPIADPFWVNTSSPICWESADICYLRSDEAGLIRILRRLEESGTTEELLRLELLPTDAGHGSYYYQTFGLSLWNGRLWFSDTVRVYSMDTDSLELKVEYSHDPSSGTFLRGSLVGDDKLYLTLSDHNGSTTTKTLRLSPEGTQSSSQNRSFNVRFSTLQIATHSRMVGL